MQVTLDPLGTKLALVARKLFPGFKPDHLLIFDLELNPTLDPAKATMGFDELIGFPRFPPAHRRIARRRTVASDVFFFGMDE